MLPFDTETCARGPPKKRRVYDTDGQAARLTLAHQRIASLPDAQATRLPDQAGGAPPRPGGSQASRSCPGVRTPTGFDPSPHTPSLLVPWPLTTPPSRQDDSRRVPVLPARTSTQAQRFQVVAALREGRRNASGPRAGSRRTGSVARRPDATSLGLRAPSSFSSPCKTTTSAKPSSASSSAPRSKRSWACGWRTFVAREPRGRPGVRSTKRRRRPSPSTRGAERGAAGEPAEREAT